MVKRLENEVNLTIHLHALSCILTCCNTVILIVYKDLANLCHKLALSSAIIVEINRVNWGDIYLASNSYLSYCGLRSPAWLLTQFSTLTVILPPLARPAFLSVNFPLGSYMYHIEPSMASRSSTSFSSSLWNAINAS